MPMSAQMSVVIDRNTTLQVPLERLAAKVTFNISMSPAMAADSRIVHLQMYNCTGEMGYFQKGLMGPVGNGGIESYTKFVPGTNAKSVTRSYYVLENMQGTVSRITTPRQRSRTNAPNRATYLWLRIERGMKFIDYRIYLGENDTNDFNVCRNTSYVYNVTVEGENSADLRVSTAKIVMYSNRPSSGQGDYNHFRQFVWRTNSLTVNWKSLRRTTTPEIFIRFGSTDWRRNVPRRLVYPILRPDHYAAPICDYQPERGSSGAQGERQGRRHFPVLERFCHFAADV